MTELAVPILGFGDEQSPPVIVVWRDGTVLCRGILGRALDPVPEPERRDNVVSFDEWRNKNESLRKRPL